MFESIQKRLSSALAKVRGKSRISESDVDAVLAEIRTGLLEGDVHFRVTRDFLARVKERALRAEVLESLSPEQQILKLLHDELVQILGGSNRELNLAVSPPAVILLCGLQGAGKTTTTVKLAQFLKAQGKQPAVVSVDVQRPAAMEQLAILASAAKVRVVDSKPTEKPVDIARRAIQEAGSSQTDVLLVDTAGRLQLDASLMNELKEISQLVKPVETLLVVDAMMGQQAVEVAEGFDREVGLTGTILTKLDGDTRGGAALSLVAVTGKPIKFVGTGERSADLDAFYPDRMASRLLDMGDVMTLIEKAQRVITEEEAASAQDKLKSSQFSLEDFRDQLRMVGRLGSLGSLVKLLPGAAAFKDQLESVDTDQELKRINAMLDSMTPLERRNPELLNGSRRARIARGSGREVSDLNAFMKRFQDARKLMKQMGKLGGMMRGMGENPNAGELPRWARRGGKGFGRKF
jgi:signal recognition particle subunit SRP54